jgi:hypothetical protein
MAPLRPTWQRCATITIVPLVIVAVAACGGTRPPATAGISSNPRPERSYRLDLDKYCAQFGKKSFLPGDSPERSMVHRKVRGPNTAFTWSCGYKGKLLAADDMSRGCRSQHPDAPKAYLLDRDNAYSWICIPSS